MISVKFSRLWVIAVCAALVVGCGGGGSSTTSGGTGGGTTGGGTGGGTGGSSSTTVTITFAGPALPVAVAAQIGTGAYAAQTLSGGTLTLTIPSGTSNYAVADLCPVQPGQGVSSQEEYVWEASIADGTSFNFACPVTEILQDFTGSLDATAIPGVQTFQVFAQNGEAVGSDITNGPTGGFAVPAWAGSNRVLALAYSANQSPGPVAAKNFDNQTVPGALNGGNTVVFGTGDETTLEPITYKNVPGGYSSPTTLVILAMGGEGTEEPYPYAQFTDNATTQYAVLPASATEKDDAYFLEASASTMNGSSQVQAGVTTSGGPVSMTFPTPWSSASPTPAALPSFTMDYTGFSGDSNVTQNAEIDWTTNDNGITETHQTNLEATANYQGKSTTLAVPDLSGVTGFLAAPASGTTVGWHDWVQQQTYGVETQPPVNGTWTRVQNGGVFTVP